MAELQKYLEQFHDTIRIDYDMSEELREKRDIILNRIRSYLKRNDLPAFAERLQGSYAMKTGVKPIKNDEYDIDVGLRFKIAENDHSANEVRDWVYTAVEGHTEQVKDKGPCARVTYADGYHVDLVCYAVWEDELGSQQFRLAHRRKGWRPADPPGLLDFVRNVVERFKDTEDSATKTDQFRRVVRYLRRWVDETTPTGTRGQVSGLALVLLAAEHLQLCQGWDGLPNDAEALQGLASRIGESTGRIVVRKPTPEYEDLFEHLSDREIENLLKSFQKLANVLQYAREQEVDPVEACKTLQSVFGKDFPVPRIEETARKTRGPAIVPSSSSG